MPFLLLLETSSKNCSVALVDEHRVIAHRAASAEHFVHAEQLHGMLEEISKEVSFSLNMLSAIAVGRGPGSYTGLRIGVSAAKGLCFALNIPLISIDTTQLLADYAITQFAPVGNVVPLIDARRMEVYMATFDGKATRMSEDSAVIVDENTFTVFDAQQLVLVGDGAEKCKAIVDKNVRTLCIMPDATMMHKRALQLFQESRFEDTAYFEPFYLKEYTPGISRKGVL
ncbi:MAG: tRNA (adenosine(37)-N6)-threonylcarbamoyltransferase complex dimerization subunit type 1 TsaB [Flavobacteriales bacterium]